MFMICSARRHLYIPIYGAVLHFTSWRKTRMSLIWKGFSGRCEKCHKTEITSVQRFVALALGLQLWAVDLRDRICCGRATSKYQNFDWQGPFWGPQAAPIDKKRQ